MSSEFSTTCKIGERFQSPSRPVAQSPRSTTVKERNLKDDLARMRRDVATRDDRASAQRDTQGYNAYDAFADTIVQDTLAGAGLVVY